MKKNSLMGRRPRSAVVRAIALLAMGWGSPGFFGVATAQSLPPTPGALLDGMEIRRPILPTGPAEVVFSKPESAAAQARDGRRFLVKGFQFSGNKALSQGQLRQVVERFVALELTLTEVKKAADAVTAYYRNKGYPLAIAIVPTQRVDDGLVIVEVIEGRVGNLTFDGANRYSTALLQSYTRPLTDQPVITMEALERSLLALNDLPGLSAAATLSAGQNRGESDVVIKVKESPFKVSFQVNNNGRTEAGAARADLTLELPNPLGFGDQLVFRKMQAERGLLDYTQWKYSIPVGVKGARVAVSQSVAKYTIAGEFSALEIGGEVVTQEVSATYPFARSRSRNIVGSIGVRETQTRQGALATPVSNNALSLLSVGGSANWVHQDSSSTTASAVFTSNLRNNTNNEPTAVLGKLDLDVTHLTGVAAKWDFYFRGNGVVSGSSLPDSEKFSIGGPDSVRGFRSSEMRGDRGYLLTGEFRRQFVMGRSAGSVSVFHDMGAVTSLGFASQDILTSAGVGMAWYPGRNSQVKVDVAWPLRHNLAKDPGPAPRTWVTASISF